MQTIDNPAIVARERSLVILPKNELRIKRLLSSGEFFSGGT